MTDLTGQTFPYGKNHKNHKKNRNSYRSAFERSELNMKIGVIFFGLIFLGILTLIGASVFAFATSGISFETIQHAPLGENVRLLIGNAIVPLFRSSSAEFLRSSVSSASL